jgi:hypothetical protein
VVIKKCLYLNSYTAISQPNRDVPNTFRELFRSLRIRSTIIHTFIDNIITEATTTTTTTVIKDIKTIHYGHIPLEIAAVIIMIVTPNFYGIFEG